MSDNAHQKPYLYQLGHRAVGTLTITLEQCKTYLSFFYAVCITCTVLTISLLIHLLRVTSSHSFSVLRYQVLDGDLSSCYTEDRYSGRTNKSTEAALILHKLIEEEKYVEAARLSRVRRESLSLATVVT